MKWISENFPEASQKIVKCFMKDGIMHQSFETQEPPYWGIPVAISLTAVKGSENPTLRGENLEWIRPPSKNQRQSMLPTPLRTCELWISPHSNFQILLTFFSGINISSVTLLEVSICFRVSYYCTNTYNEKTKLSRMSKKLFACILRISSWLKHKHQNGMQVTRINLYK